MQLSASPYSIPSQSEVDESTDPHQLPLPEKYGSARSNWLYILIPYICYQANKTTTKLTPMQIILTRTKENTRLHILHLRSQAIVNVVTSCQVPKQHQKTTDWCNVSVKLVYIPLSPHLHYVLSQTLDYLYAACIKPWSNGA